MSDAPKHKIRGARRLKGKASSAETFRAKKFFSRFRSAKRVNPKHKKHQNQGKPSVSRAGRRVLKQNKGKERRIRPFFINNVCAQYWHKHRQAMQNTADRMLAARRATLATILVMAIVLSLPASLYLFLKNAKAMTQGWNEPMQMSLYLKQSTSLMQSDAFIEALQKREEFQSVVFVSPQQGLDEFQKQEGIGQVLQYLDHNPLPAVIVLTPTAAYSTENHLKALLEEFNQHTRVMEAKLDFQWVRRVWAAIEVAQTSVYILSALLFSTVLLVLGNTIRLLIEDRKREIELMKLIGATNTFIRRPFLYMGAMLGVGASILAFLIVMVIFEVIQAPVAQLFTEFHAQFFLLGLSLKESLVLIGVGFGLGLMGAWFVATWYLREIHPE